MNDDIFAGVDPIDSSVVKFGAWLLRESQMFTSVEDKLCAKTLFAPKVPKPHGRLKITQHKAAVNRGGKLVHFEFGKEYPIGCPHGINDQVFTDKEAAFFEKRGFCEILC